MCFSENFVATYLSPPLKALLPLNIKITRHSSLSPTAAASRRGAGVGCVGVVFAGGSVCLFSKSASVIWPGGAAGIGFAYRTGPGWWLGYVKDGVWYSRGVKSFKQDIGRAARDDDDTRVTDPGEGGGSPVAPLLGCA